MSHGLPPSSSRWNDRDHRGPSPPSSRRSSGRTGDSLPSLKLLHLTPSTHLLGFFQAPRSSENTIYQKCKETPPRPGPLEDSEPTCGCPSLCRANGFRTELLRREQIRVREKKEAWMSCFILKISALLSQVAPVVLAGTGEAEAGGLPKISLKVQRPCLKKQQQIRVQCALWYGPVLLPWVIK